MPERKQRLYRCEDGKMRRGTFIEEKGFVDGHGWVIEVAGGTINVFPGDWYESPLDAILAYKNFVTSQIHEKRRAFDALYKEINALENEKYALRVLFDQFTVHQIPLGADAAEIKSYLLEQKMTCDIPFVCTRHGEAMHVLTKCGHVVVWRLPSGELCHEEYVEFMA